MNPQAIRFFLMVVRHGSFRQAGESLHVAASAVNRQVTLLEGTLEAPLFERRRGRTRLQLTAAGEIFLLHARAATHQLARAKEQIAALQGLEGGSVTIGVPETLTRDFFPEFLGELHASMPRISFRVIVENSPRLIEMLAADQLDIAIVYNPAPNPAVHTVARLERKTYLMMHGGHPLASRTAVRLSDYAQYPVVLPSESTSMWPFYEEILAKLGAKPRVALVTSSYEMLRSAARVGMGLAIVNDYLLPRNGNGPEDAVFVPIVDRLVKPQTLACCVRARRRLPVAVSVAVERLKDALGRFA